MSGARVQYSEQARDEVDEIYFRIMLDTGPNAADAMLDRLDRLVQNLATFPSMGRVRTELPGSPRTFSLHPWVLLYRPLTSEKGIQVLRLIDGRRDLDALLLKGG
jgi:plasmid stabilization system protein ParE